MCSLKRLMGQATITVEKNLSHSDQQPVRESSAPWLVLAAVCFFVFFFRLGSAGLVDPGDGYFTEAAREMIERGDFITPHLNYQIYFSKPILIYWLIISAFSVFGVNEFAARFWSAALASILVFCTYWTVRAVGGKRAGLLSGLVVATSPLVVTFGRMALVDMVFSSLLGIALCATAMTGIAGSKKWWPVIYLSLALAVLTKGPAALVFFAIGGAAYLGAMRPSREWITQKFRELHMVKGALLFTAVTVPWYLAVGLATNWLFLKVFFLFENLGRFSGQTNHLNANPFYYVLVMAYGFFPWILFLPMAIKNTVAERKLAFETTERGRRVNTMLLCLLWAAGVMIFFSLSKTKLQTYILPIAMPIGAIVGLALDDWLNEPKTELRPRFLKICSYLLGAVGIGALVAGLAVPFLNLKFFNPTLTALASAGGITFGIAWFVQLLKYRKGDLQGCIAALVAGAVFAMGFGAPVAFQVGFDLREAEIKNITAQVLTHNMRLALFDDFKPALLFYVKQPIDSFFQPDQLEAHEYAPDEPRQYVIVSDKRLPDLKALHGDKFRNVAKGQKWGVYEAQGLKIRKLPTLQQTFAADLNLNCGDYTWGTLPFAAGEFPVRKAPTCSTK
jgi:4-amino-4-deoxy-L-arabinose transferase-like glycosyltransferase